LARLLRAAPQADLVVLWSFGITAFLLPLLRRWADRTTWAVVLHEPGGLRAKLAKGDGRLRAVVSAVLEWTATRGADYVVVPREDKVSLVKGSRALSLPLLYATAVPSEGSVPRTDVLYLGRRDARRKLELFSSDEFRCGVQAALGGCRFAFFPPVAGVNADLRDKEAALARARVVLNFYTVPYNQSGVTVESLVHGVPVVVSNHDPYADRLAPLGLALPPDAADDMVMSAVTGAAQAQAGMADSLRRLGDDLGGESAFLRKWLPWLNEVAERRGRRRLVGAKRT
jgi:hypothetical protein